MFMSIRINYVKMENRVYQLIIRPLYIYAGIHLFPLNYNRFKTCNVVYDTTNSVLLNNIT